jgi:EAL domain-containing protein (putative c-di-GMP-specific phosphodiesterase class I)
MIFAHLPYSRSKINVCACVCHRIELSSTARQIEVYIGDAYHSTVKCATNASHSTSYDARFSLSSPERVFKLKFLSLSDKSKRVFQLDSMILTCKLASSASKDSLRKLPVDPHLAVGNDAVVSMISNLIDTKLNPIFVRLEALEMTVMRNENALANIMKMLSSGVRGKEIGHETDVVTDPLVSVIGDAT